MVCTEDHMAQYLEGSPEAVEEVIRECRRDSWHSEGKIVVETAENKRKFSCWNLVYSGPSSYVEERIRPLLQGDLPEGERNAIAGQLIDIIISFSNDD
jgi:hypothetical protein